MESLPYNKEMCNKEMYEEHWSKYKSLANVTRQNLNMDFKEKEVNYKLNLDDHCHKNQNSLPHTHKRDQPRLQHFIDNKSHSSFSPTSKIRNKDSNEAVVTLRGFGRGISLHNKAKAMGHVNNLYYHPLHGTNRSGDDSSLLLASSIKNQVREVIGDIYSDRALRKSLEELSSYQTQKGPSCGTCGLERTFSDISLVSNSGSSVLGNDLESSSTNSDDASMMVDGAHLPCGGASLLGGGANLPGGGASLVRGTASSCQRGVVAHEGGDAVHLNSACNSKYVRAEPHNSVGGAYNSVGGTYDSVGGAYNSVGGARSRNTTHKLGNWVPCETMLEPDFNISDHNFPALK